MSFRRHTSLCIWQAIFHQHCLTAIGMPVSVLDQDWTLLTLLKCHTKAPDLLQCSGRLRLRGSFLYTSVIKRIHCQSFHRSR
jgi:hypothetical protein